MDQKPMRGVAPLDPPSPEVARRFLDEAEAVTERRDAHVDLRGQGWLTITEAAVMLLFIACAAVLIRADQPSHMSLPLFALIASSQILGGAAQRGGAQRRFSRNRAAYVAVVTFACVAMVGTGILTLAAPQLPLALVLLPAAVGAMMLAGTGIRLLWLGRTATRPVRRDRQPFAWPARAMTIGLGVLLGTLIIVAGTADMLVSTLLALLAAAAIIVMSIGSRTEWGLFHLGEVWRWPQFSMFAFGSLVLAAVVTLGTRSDLVNPISTVVLGALVVLLAVLASLVGISPRGGRNG